MRNRSSISMALSLLAVLAVACAPAAAEGFKDGQWWGSVDGYWAQPLDVNLEPGVQFNTKITDGGQVLSVPFDHEFSARIRAGWRDGNGDNTYSVSVWDWNHDSSLDLQRLIIPTLSDPFFGNVLSARVESDAKIQSRIVDFMVSRKLASTKKGSWFYGVGVRQASFRQNWDNKYFDIDPNTFLLFVEEQANISIHTTGIGLTMGLGSSYQWSHRWRTSARAQIAMLQGSTDSNYNDRFITLDPNSPGGFFLQEAELRRNNDRRLQQQIEIEARVSYNVWKTLDINLGYNFLQWSDVTEFDRIVDDVQSTPLFRRGNVAFHGATLGASYWF
jgi:hypothetical protein